MINLDIGQIFANEQPELARTPIEGASIARARIVSVRTGQMRTVRMEYPTHLVRHEYDSWRQATCARSRSSGPLHCGTNKRQRSCAAKQVFSPGKNFDNIHLLCRGHCANCRILHTHAALGAIAHCAKLTALRNTTSLVLVPEHD